MSNFRKFNQFQRDAYDQGVAQKIAAEFSREEMSSLVRFVNMTNSTPEAVAALKPIDSAPFLSIAKGEISAALEKVVPGEVLDGLGDLVDTMQDNPAASTAVLALIAGTGFFAYEALDGDKGDWVSRKLGQIQKLRQVVAANPNGLTSEGADAIATTLGLTGVGKTLITSFVKNPTAPLPPGFERSVSVTPVAGPKTTFDSALGAIKSMMPAGS